MTWLETSVGSLVTLVPLALASAFMPTRTVMTARLMLTARPVPNALAFIAGNWVWRPILGLIILSTLGFDATGLARWADQTFRTAAGVLSLVFAVLALLQWRVGSRFNDERFERWSERLDGLGPSAVFAATLAVMWIPGTQWLLVIAGCAVIHASGVSAPLQIVLLVLFTVGQLVMVASPLLMRAAADRHGDQIRRNADRLRSRAVEKGFVVFALLSFGCAIIAFSSLIPW